jgi:uncharacterized spore protein YtfJ
MRERADGRETLRAGPPLRVGGVTLLPIERVVVRPHRAAQGGWVTAALEPYALVVRDAGGVRVVEIDGAATSLEQLGERVSGLDAWLAAGDR